MRFNEFYYVLTLQSPCRIVHRPKPGASEQQVFQIVVENSVGSRLGDLEQLAAKVIDAAKNYAAGLVEAQQLKILSAELKDDHTTLTVHSKTAKRLL